MKKNHNKIISLTLALILMVTQVPSISVFAEETPTPTQGTEITTDNNEDNNSNSTENESSEKKAEQNVEPSVTSESTTDIQSSDEQKDNQDGSVEVKQSQSDSDSAEEKSTQNQSDEKKSVQTYDEFLNDLTVLENYSSSYVNEHGGEDEYALIINYIRSGVERYTSSAWTTFCGPENTSFINYIANKDAENGTSASALRNIEQFTLPNGDEVDFGHMFGCMDMAYHTKNQDTADLGSWAGDLCDLLWLVTTTGIQTGTVDEMADIIRTENDKYFLHAVSSEGGHSFSQTDFYGDLDSTYVLKSMENNTPLSTIFKNYFTKNLTDKYRIKFFLDTRFPGKETREDIRDAIYSTYLANEGIRTLEGTYITGGINSDIRKACCYALADYLYLNSHDDTQKSYYKVFSSESSTLAPGITQVEKRAMTTDDKQIVYYLATADVSRKDVNIYANYKDNDPSKWGMQRVSEQMNAAEKKHSNAKDKNNYVPNYKVVVGVNADYYNMSTGEPSGALIMNGKEYKGIGDENFFAILKDGTPMIGGTNEWNDYKDQIQEAVGGGGWLVRNGKTAINETSDYYNNRASRTCVGITYDGKVVLMVLDGRQEPFSAGGSAEEIAQIMLDAGCVSAINLDGGGSSTFASKAEGSDSISVVNRPSDGYERSVSSSLLVVSTAKPSNEFDHAVISSDYDYLTVGSKLSLTVSGVSATGGAVDVPKGAKLKLEDDSLGTLSDDNTFTASKLGDARIQLISNEGDVLGTKTLHVVEPTDLKTSKESVNAVYGEAVDLPIEATYNGNPVKINSKDVTFGYRKVSLASMGTVEGGDVNTTKVELVYDYPEAGSIAGFKFTPSADSKLRTVTIGAVLKNKMNDLENAVQTEYTKAYQEALNNGLSSDNAALQAQTAAVDKAMELAAKVTVYMYKSNEAGFDFNNAMGKDNTGILSWNRIVDDSSYDPDDSPKYILKDNDATGSANYTFAVDMTKVPIPDKLQGLLYMLPGGDQQGKTAWDFMLQLAERISPLTNVTLTMNIPDGFTVDTKDLRLVNDFFNLESAKVDGNTLTIRLGFIQQTESVNPTNANPICVLSGLKIIPKSNANWSEEGKLDCNITGKVNYDIYAHFHVLKSLASQTEYQEKYGLYPYDNSENLHGDYGAHFPNDVISFTDSYSLIKGAKKGWTQENGQWSYYKDNQPLTGVQKLPSFEKGEKGNFWYDLGEKGTCTGKLTGLFENNGNLYYAVDGQEKTGWRVVTDSNGKDKDYYFDPNTKAAVDGKQTISKVSYVFKDKVLTEGSLVWKSSTTLQYYWAGQPIYAGLIKINGDYYYFSTSKFAVLDKDYYITKTNGLLPMGTYHFDKDGKMVTETKPDEPKTDTKNGLVQEKDGLYYYKNGVRTHAGLLQVNGSYYYIKSNGEAVTGRYYVSNPNNLMAVGWYEFDKDGKMVTETKPDEPKTDTKNGLVQEKDGLYYYKNGVRTHAGLIQVNGSYYYIKSNGEAVTGRYYVSNPNNLMAVGWYQFDDNGKMVTK